MNERQLRASRAVAGILKRDKRWHPADQDFDGGEWSAGDMARADQAREEEVVEVVATAFDLLVHDLDIAWQEYQWRNNDCYFEAMYARGLSKQA